MKQADERTADARRRKAFLVAIGSSLDELIHNLQHFAHQVDDDHSFKSFPAITFEATFALLHQDIAPFCAPPVLTRIRNLQRITSHNRAILKSAGEVDRSVKIFALLDEAGIVELQRDKWLVKASEPLPGNSSAVADPAPAAPLDYLGCDERVITHSVRAIMELARHHRNGARGIVDAKEFKWLRRFADSDEQAWSYYTKSSELDEATQADLRSEGLSLYCWIKDGEIEGVDVIPVRMAFRDMAHRPH